ncbi:hypothetical protein JNUCC1_03371 [Lentibacillus sp. JNUCC-1]|uniref:hypothetical protein n=1 Tax=Lentibacillus sp. JNUCC-1 TaxID=2654513 RepID=UPI0012E70FF8|nr:hypothetical protein [Lentibacillus sp. JNUCC-1]MUV39493.1 hypothetical protein [Lentibacillus sp. JNUCC-1]
MLNSNTRKKSLSGWLKNNYEQEFSNGLKLQKFLFFYEALSKIDNDDYDFNYLKGYKRGPVFSNVYGDYTYRKDEFINAADEAYQLKPELINEERARFSGFLTRVLNEEELSDLTHEMNIWNEKELEIMSEVKQIPLNEDDLNENDVSLMETLRQTYPSNFINSTVVIEVEDKSFVIDKDDFNKLTEEQQNLLLTLSDNDELENPVYVKISEDGVLLVD